MRIRKRCVMEFLSPTPKTCTEFRKIIFPNLHWISLDFLSQSRYNSCIPITGTLFMKYKNRYERCKKYWCNSRQCENQYRRGIHYQQLNTVRTDTADHYKSSAEKEIFIENPCFWYTQIKQCRKHQKKINDRHHLISECVKQITVTVIYKCRIFENNIN